jgi:hypothetical protein
MSPFACEMPGRASSGPKVWPGMSFPILASKVTGSIVVGVSEPRRVVLPSTFPRK